MGLPPSESPSHPYSQAIQLKLYQAFIFSVPILFSIILILLFYLFYLKRRRDSNNLSSPSSTLSRRSAALPTPLDPLPFEVCLKEELKEKLPITMFDEALRAKDSQCCVCLGEFEVKEQLHQIPDCKHVFHIECIHHWLQANTTCPLCRCSIISTTKLHSHSQQNPPLSNSQESNSNHQHPHQELTISHLEVVSHEV